MPQLSPKRLGCQQIYDEVGVCVSHDEKSEEFVYCVFSGQVDVARENNSKKYGRLADDKYAGNE